MENCGNQKNYVSKAFGSTVNLLIIVEKETKNDVSLLCDKLKQILYENPDKKIIIIGSKTSPTAAALINASDSSQNQILPTKITFNKLTKKSQSLIRSKTNVTFQGNTVSLDNLIKDNESAAKLIDSETLQKMILGEKIIIGERIEGFDKNEKSYYHPRKFALTSINPEVFKENALVSNHIFAIEGTNVLEFLNIKNVDKNEVQHAEDFIATNPKRFIITEKSNEEFKKISKDCPEYFLHWLKLKGDTLMWFYSYIPISKRLTSDFTRHISRESNYVNESFFYEYVKQNQVVIICDIAGMGKTTVLKSFSQTLNERNMWKIRINLNQYTSTLLQIKKYIEKHKLIIEDASKLHLNFADLDPEKKDYQKLILKSLINYKEPDVSHLNFENKILNNFFENKNMLFIFDGYDEINPDYGNEVTILLQKLNEN
uniref:NACHT domain-containing protein n=1 Tax=Panagrolaimus sp. ES5 TaxID=591445 RepID=A0AC34FUJ0_9BILA